MHISANARIHRQLYLPLGGKCSDSFTRLSKHGRSSEFRTIKQSYAVNAWSRFSLYHVANRTLRKNILNLKDYHVTLFFKEIFSYSFQRKLLIEFRKDHIFSIHTFNKNVKCYKLTRKLIPLNISVSNFKVTIR